MSVARLSDFASTSTTANAERFGTWTSSGGSPNRITLLATCLSGTATDADIRVSVGGRIMHVVASATQQTTRRVVALELLAHELPKGTSWPVAVYWPSATRIHITAVEWSGTRQRPTPSGDVFFATSASAQNANLTATAPTSNAALHMMCWFGGTSSWTLGSGQTKVGSDNQQTTFLSVGGYETGLASGSQASNCSVAAAANAIGQICMVLAEDTQDVSSLDPADGATGVATSPDLELTLTATAVEGTGSLRVYETSAPSSSATVDDAATSSNSTNASPFAASVPTTSAGKRLLVIVATDGSRYSAGVITDTGSPSPWHGSYRGAGFIVVYRECDGTEPSSYNFATSPADGCVSRAYLISGHDPNTPPSIAFAIGDSSTVNPPSLSFPWGSEPTLVFAFAGMDNGSTVSGANYPSGYTGTGTQASTQATAGDRAGLGWCYKSGVTSGSEDPGNFSLTAGEGWNGITVAIRPADPSVLVDTIDATDAVFSSTTATFSASGLAPSTAHHVRLDAGAIQDFEGFHDRTSWNFTTDAGGDDPLEGSSASTLGAVTSSAAATLTIAGSGAVTLGAVSSSAAATLAVQGSAAATLGALSSSAAGAISIAGEAALGLAALTSSAASTLAIDGTSSVTLGSLTSSAAGSLALGGQASVTLGALASSAAGALALEGQASLSLGTATSSAASTLSIEASAALTLGAVTASATGELEVEGYEGLASVTLGALSSSASARLDVAGSASITLDGLSATAQASLALAGLGAVSLGPLTSAAASALSLDAEASIILDALIAAGIGTDGTSVTPTKVSVSHTPGMRLATHHVPGRGLGTSHTPGSRLRTF